MKKFIFIFFIISSIYIFSQDNTDDWKVKTNKFRLEQLAKDIIKADLIQLKSMAMALGLEEQDNAQAYRAMLAKYYNITLLNTNIEKHGSKIILERAGELKTIKFTEDNEENLHILGRVKLILNSKDSENKELSRTIEADEININTKTKEISGLGNVHFKDDKLEFNGDQFYYNYDINRGALLKGKTQLIKGGDSGLDGAFFHGDKVTQTGKDDVTLYDGTLTTCPEDNPHYYMKVTRLWLSEKGEWGLLNGVFYIGPVPFFYFPVYYHPKNFYINPAFGFKSREGWYFNSTYYILGEKDTGSAQTTTSTTSMQQLINARRQDDSTGTTDPKLVKTIPYSDIYKFYNKYKLNPPMMSSDAITLTWNFFLDMYTNLGYYWGTYFFIKANYTNFPFKFKILSDFAFSRTIWKDKNTGLYYPYNPEDKFTYGDNSYFNFNKNPLVFRTSQWARLKGELFKDKINFAYDFQIDYATDNSFYLDFYNRKLDFTYFDALADLISYNLMKNSNGITSFQTTGTSNANQDTLTNSDIKQTYASFTLSLLQGKYPNILGLNIISDINMRVDNTAELIATVISKLQQTDIDNPKEVKYLLSSFSFPSDPNLDTNLINIKGTLLDYETFTNMPVKALIYKKDLSGNNTNNEASLLNDMYIHLNEYKMKDTTTDSSEIDYKLLLPVYSKKITLSQANIDINKYVYENVISEDISQTEKIQKDKSDNKKEEKDVTYSNYDNVIKQDTYKNLSYDLIKPVEFKMEYDFREKLANKFYFDTDTTINKDRYVEYDTIQLLLQQNKGQELIKEILEQFNIYNKIYFSLGQGPGDMLNILKLFNNPLFGFKPQFYIDFRKSMDQINIYTDYQYNNKDNTVQNIETNVRNLLIKNYTDSYLLIKFKDENITNDLSFGLYSLKGTMIKTEFSLNIFMNNLLSERNFRILNYLNSANSRYQKVDPIYYYNMVGYERIEKLRTYFTFNVNFIEEKNPHQLSMGVAPLINWVIPTSNIDSMKAELFLDWGKDINYSYKDDLTNEAKMYLSYRYHYMDKNGRLHENLNDKIYNFFDPENFWKGPKNYRYMFDNVTINTKYSYTPNISPTTTLQAIVINNDLVFRLTNIGTFSNLGKQNFSTGVYPDDNFTINFLNSIISYNCNISFTKRLNPYISDMTIDQQKLDEYNVMTMDNKHSLTLRIPGTLFETKLPSGDWLNFTSSTTFRWDRTIPVWSNGSKYNFFYLDSQTISLNLLMDIFKFSLTFKKYNFQNDGYGLELDNGSIEIGHNITEIPIFWNYFKLTMFPSLKYTFFIKHNPYYDTTNLKYDDTSLRQYTTDYYENNMLTFSFSAKLEILVSTKYYTSLEFYVESKNKKMYKYYQPNGFNVFFKDLADSFNFGDIQARRRSPFDLQLIKVTLNHTICDWTMSFSYIGAPKLSLTQGDNTTQGRYNWENRFEFAVTWGIDTKNQLMELFNKTKVDAVYNYEKDSKWTGNWQQPDLSLDPNEQNSTTTTSQ